MKTTLAVFLLLNSAAAQATSAVVTTANVAVPVPAYVQQEATVVVEKATAAAEAELPVIRADVRAVSDAVQYDVAVVKDTMAQQTVMPVVPAGTNAAMAQNYADAAAAVPSEANFNIGDQKMKLNIDEAAIKDALSYEQKFWQNDARKLEDIPRLFQQPIEEAKGLIAKRLEPIINAQVDLMQNGMMQFDPNPNTCDPVAFLQCKWNKKEQLDPNDIQTWDNWYQDDCASNTGCKAQYPFFTSSQGQQWQGDMMASEQNAQESFRNLQRELAQSFSGAAQQAAAIIEPMAQNWMKQRNDIMINDLKCDKTCTTKFMSRMEDTFTAVIGGACSCQLPVQPGAAFNWTTIQDFSQVSLQEWLDIAANNQQDLTMMADDTAPADPVTPPADPVTPPANEQTADPAAASGNSMLWWILGIGGVVGLGGGFYFYQKKNSESEGGSDLYSRFIDEETEL